MAKLSVSFTPRLFFGAEQVEERRLLGVVGLGRISGRGTNAAIGFADQLLVRQGLVGRIAPEFLAHELMQPLGEGLGDAVGERLDEDRRVIVVGALEALGDQGFLGARRDDEAADVIGKPGLARRDEIGEREIAAAVALHELLAQGEERGEPRVAALVRVERDVVADRIRRPEADDGLRT